MRRYIVISGLCTVFLWIACNSEQNMPEGQTFGGKVTIEKTVSIAEVYTDPQKYEGKEIRMDGEITQVCQHKGCWIKMTDGQKELVVRFKDYGFFVPKDAARSKVTIQGIFTTNADKHVMEEAEAQEKGEFEGHAPEDGEEEEHHKKEENKEVNDSDKDDEMPYSFVAHAVIIYPATN